MLIAIQKDTKSSTLFKNFARLVEDAFVTVAKGGSEVYDSDIVETSKRAAAYYISQIAPDFKCRDNELQLLEKLEQVGVKEEYFRDLIS